MRISAKTALAGTLSLIVTVGMAQSSQVPSGHVWRGYRVGGPVMPVSKSGKSARYIVLFGNAPVPLYTGGTANMQATSPHVTGARHLDVYSRPVRVYANYLKTRQAEFLKQASQALGHKLVPHFQYQYALNGMSVSLTARQAVAIAHMPGVLSVQPVHYYRPTATVAIPASASDTFTSRSWINAPTVWADPTFNNLDNEGEGIVVADIDTGINAANLSFAATGPKDGYVTQDPLGSGKYLGVCDSNNATDGTLADAATYPQTYQSGFPCNDKLIGAYTYTLATKNDPNSPEDSEGHGSHTASTIAGNFVDATILGNSIPISGVAPHANIIAYDVCDPTDQCGSDTSVAAVDQAIKDQSTIKAAAGSAFKGMVLNYSIGGGEYPYTDPVEKAFLSAVEAGIYVSAAAGNGGPGNTILNDPTQLYPVEHWAPWDATVAASTHNGVFSSNNVTGFTGGDAITRASVPATINGEGVTASLSLSNIVYAGDGSYDYSPYPGTFSTSDKYTLSGVAYADPSAFTAHQAASECLYPFPAGTFSGKIVVCDRGDIPLVDKADNVYQGGAAGIVIVSQAGNALIAEPYEIPGTMIGNADGLNLEAWLKASVGASTPAQAQLTGTSMTTDATQADQLADFSSRGPTNTVYDDVIKPDLTAPGVNVLAAVADPKFVNGGPDQPETYDFYDGTSMATPHDTGAAALLMQLHSNWTPAETRSALMLTAVTSTLTDQCASLDSSNNCVPGNTVPSPQVRGAGRIDLDTASRTGLVLDENGTDYQNADPATGGDLTSLNLPSMANQACVTSCSWTRTFTSAMQTATAQYSLAFSNLPSGLQMSVSPTSFSLAPGATQTITVTANVSSVTAGQWLTAQLDITTSSNGDDGQPIPAMHMPISIFPKTPAPLMSISPTKLTMSVAQGKTGNSTLTVNNSGTADLHWQLSTTNSTQVGNIWTQPSTGSGNGYPSTFYTVNGHGIYSAGHFVMPVSGTIATLSVEGFAVQNGQPVNLNVATALDWYIYADNGGAPLGNPENGLNNYVWHYRSAPSGAGVNISSGSMALDLAAAGQALVKLPAGTYWLVVYPTLNSDATNSNDANWYWEEGKSADGAADAKVIDPSGLLNQGLLWQATQSSLDFTLTGTLNCSNSGVAGLSFSVQSGTIVAGTSSSVQATFDSNQAQLGLNTGGICFAGDDPVHPLIALPVSLTVTANSTSGGSSGSTGSGGGGTIGLLALALLGMGAGITRRRRMQ